MACLCAKLQKIVVSLQAVLTKRGMRTYHAPPFFQSSMRP